MTETAPRIALGTMHFGTRTGEQDAFALLDAYLDGGGVWVDTANCYAFWGSDDGHGGQSEEVIGRWLARRGVRDRVRLSTKVGAEPTVAGGFPEHAEGLSRSVVRDGLAGSLRRLGVESVDLFWAHKEDVATPIAEVTEAFGSVVADGQAGAIGLSNHPAWYAAAANAVAQAAGSAPFTVLQKRDSYLHPRPDTPVEGEDHPNGMMTPEDRDFAARNGIGLWAYTPLLTGLYEHPERDLPAAYEHPGTHARLERLRHWAGELSLKPSQLVIAWLLAEDPATTPIVGVSSTDQLSDALAATRVELPAEALADLSGTH